jgi:hypothetical protein
MAAAASSAVYISSFTTSEVVWRVVGVSGTVIAAVAASGGG